ncbi:MAG TPA: HAMP domain-containing sensor histidine kinase, partial [Candidatus Saccharimonadales bacterium]|nr:HAMP domain-containing sensor histidine kinase [Candidatus Saccharimonadales bacterium]
AVLVIRDITEESNADRTKSEIISIASHQLRTPLTTVRWYVNELIKNRKLLPSKRTSYLTQVRDSNRRMIDLVEHLLNVSRIELGTLTLKPERIDVANLVASILADLKAKIDDKQLHILTETSPPPPIAFADRSALQIVLQNIISNAIEFSYEKGTVVITLTNHAEHITIRVADQGCGIPVVQQSHIFTKLFRASNAYKLSTTGSGLGLYISKALTEQMEGKIWFTSHENKGTTMYVTVPTKRKRKE